MTTELTQKAQGYFQQHFGIPFDELLSPIDSQEPAGKSVRGNGVYNAIKEARREDDPSVPLGPWAYELKRADWDKVSDMAVNALANKSKDLQIAAWLLEAQINKHGFEGIGACILLIQALCERYWDALHPRLDDGDLEYRINIIRWVNDKLLPAIRLVPITATGRGPREYNWADWEQAKRNEQIRGAIGARPEHPPEGLSVAEFSSAMAGTSTEVQTIQYRHLQDALDSIEALDKTLDALCAQEAPSLNGLASLMEQIQGLIASELHKRGVRLVAASRGKGEAAGGKKGAPEGGAAGDTGGGGDGGPIRDRADAYARLAQAADFLMHIEPHSPAPYLVKRAIEWGNLNTAELYHELFLKFNGHLSIFEVLGIQPDRPRDEPAATDK